MITELAHDDTQELRLANQRDLSDLYVLCPRCNGEEDSCCLCASTGLVSKHTAKTWEDES